MWFPLALGGAVCQAVQFAVVKGGARHIPPLVLMAWSQAISFVAWLVYVLVTGTRVSIPLRAWAGIAAAVVLANGMGFLLTRASARGDISIVGPVLALSPIFAIVPDAVLSGTLPRGVGWLGLALSVIGTTSLSGRVRGGFGLAELFRRADALDALGSAVLLGMLSAVDRMNALALGVPVYLCALYATMLTVTVLFIGRRAPRTLVAWRAPADIATLLTNGVLNTLGTGLQIAAMTFAPAAYVNAIRRTSAVISVVLGRALFREAGMSERLAAAILTSIGAACLALAR